MSDRFCFVNGLRIHYLDWVWDSDRNLDRGGPRPDLVLVHPTGFVANIWQPLVERLGGRFHAVALDLRGHGDSDKPAGDYGVERLMEDLHAFLAAVGLDHPIGIGHSAGATTIAAVEARWPGSFRRAVLMDPVLDYDPPPGPRTLADDPLAAGALKRRAVWPSRAAAYASYRSRPPFRTWDEAVLRQYVEHGFADRSDGQVELKCRPEDESLMYLKGSHGWAAGELIPHVRCPVLLIGGADSPIFGAAVAERTAALLPDCRLAIIPGGHFAPFEYPRRAEEEILRFLEGVTEGLTYDDDDLARRG